MKNNKPQIDWSARTSHNCLYGCEGFALAGDEIKPSAIDEDSVTSILSKKFFRIELEETSEFGGNGPVCAAIGQNQDGVFVFTVYKEILTRLKSGRLSDQYGHYIPLSARTMDQKEVEAFTFRRTHLQKKLIAPTCWQELEALMKCDLSEFDLSAAPCKVKPAPPQKRSKMETIKAWRDEDPEDQ